jgi:hypothetical protein
VGFLQPALGPSPRRQGLIEFHLVVGGVDLDEQRPRLDPLIVIGQHLPHAPGHARRHLAHVRIDESVVGGLVVSHVQPVRNASTDHEQNDGGNAYGQKAFPKGSGRSFSAIARADSWRTELRGGGVRARLGIHVHCGFGASARAVHYGRF